MRLQDHLGRVQTRLRLSVTDRCAFRCLYCSQDADFGPKELLLSFEEIEQAVRAFAQLGISEVRLTGGEPLQRRSVERLALQLRKVPGIRRLSMTTNGYHLPERAAALKAVGIDDVNVSLDTLQPSRFQKICGVAGLDRVIAGIRAAKEAGLKPKINMVVLRGVNEDEILGMLRFSRQEGVMARFIEYMPVAGLPWKPELVVTAAEIIHIAGKLGTVQPLPAAGGPASLYRISPSGQIFGIIPTISQPFCKNCNRIRLSARGELFTCLFAQRGFLIRPYLYDPDLPLLLHQIVYQKGGGFAAQQKSRIAIPMVQMGG